jgi:hypothetical protein
MHSELTITEKKTCHRLVSKEGNIRLLGKPHTAQKPPITRTSKRSPEMDGAKLGYMANSVSPWGARVGSKCNLLATL